MAKKIEESTTALVPPPTNTGLAVFDYGEDLGKGYENQTKADMAIPFINQLQALSPLVVQEKAKAGDYFNTVTQEIFPRDKGFLLVPGGTRRAFAKWVPKKNRDGTDNKTSGSGYRGEYAVESPEVAKAVKESIKFGVYYDDDGLILRDTRYVYGALCSESGVHTMAIMPFWSTKIKPYQAWMTRMRQFTLQDAEGKTIMGPDNRPARPPIYSHLTRITSFHTPNSNQEWYYIPEIKSADPRGLAYSLIGPSDERFQMAKDCKMLFESGEAKVDYSQAQPEDADDDSTTGSPFGT